jgi:hypothetical protein
MHRRSAHKPSAVSCDFAEALALQVRDPRPRRAHARRSCFRTRRVSPNVCGIGVAGAVSPTHRWYDRATAGSRPPLFFGVRLCIAKIVFRRQTFVHQHKSGGRKPPVVTINANATAIPPRTPSAVPRTSTLASAQTCFPHPRRADGRRSCFRTRRVSPTVCGIGVAGAFP